MNNRTKLKSTLLVSALVIWGCSAESTAHSNRARDDGSDHHVEDNSTGAAKPTDADLKAKLSDLQYYVTQKNGTERPFDNAYWNHKEPGIYVDIVSGEPLFSSLDKFKSGTGWPSFTSPLESANVVENKDLSHGMTRVEVRSKNADSHLGHLFNDGPEPTGLRYCINSASLRFVPADRLQAEGYAEYASLFGTAQGRANPNPRTAVLAAGCFWCTEAIYEAQPGVLDVISGYAGGSTENPTYQQVGSQETGHTESIEITYDPAVTSYRTLVDLLWKTFDPTDGSGVWPDFGDSYRPVVFYSTEDERKQAEASRDHEQQFHGKPIQTEIKALEKFYPAEKYHQDFVRRNPDHRYVRNVSYPRMAEVGVLPEPR